MRDLFEHSGYRIAGMKPEYADSNLYIFSKNAKDKWELSNTVKPDGSGLYTLIHELIKNANRPAN